MVSTRLIDGDALLHIVNNCDLTWDGGVDINELNTFINEMPTVEPQERKTGKWIYCEDTVADCVDGYRCDQCGLFVPWDYKHKGIDFIKDYHFCPNCGARME